MAIALLGLTALVSAFLPFIPIEVLLAGAIRETASPWWALALVATVGQMVGKTVIFLIGRQSMNWGWLQRRLHRHNLDATVTRISNASNRRPLVLDLTVAGSAFCGFPPFAVTSLVAGHLECSLTRFVLSGTLGRLVRFVVIAIAVQQSLQVM